MSNINDLIHTNARIAYQQGVMREREYIMSTLKTIASEFKRKEELDRAIAKLEKELDNERA